MVAELRNEGADSELTKSKKNKGTFVHAAPCDASASLKCVLLSIDKGMIERECLAVVRQSPSQADLCEKSNILACAKSQAANAEPMHDSPNKASNGLMRDNLQDGGDEFEIAASRAETKKSERGADCNTNRNFMLRNSQNKNAGLNQHVLDVAGSGSDCGIRLSGRRMPRCTLSDNTTERPEQDVLCKTSNASNQAIFIEKSARLKHDNPQMNTAALVRLVACRNIGTPKLVLSKYKVIKLS